MQSLARLAVCDLLCDAGGSSGRRTHSSLAIHEPAQCTMTKTRLVPCSTAAPPAIASANVHRRVTRQPQCVLVFVCVVLPEVVLPLVLVPSRAMRHRPVGSDWQVSAGAVVLHHLNHSHGYSG